MSLMLITLTHGNTMLHTKIAGVICRITEEGEGGEGHKEILNHAHSSL